MRVSRFYGNYNLFVEMRCSRLYEYMENLLRKNIDLEND
jgi:hypothetical protein